MLVIIKESRSSAYALGDHCARLLCQSTTMLEALLCRTNYAEKDPSPSHPFQGLNLAAI